MYADILSASSLAILRDDFGECATVAADAHVSPAKASRHPHTATNHTTRSPPIVRTGPSGLVNSITAGIIDASITYFNAKQNAVVLPNLDVTGALRPYLKYADRAAANANGPYADLTAHGGLYYLGSVADPDIMVPATSPNAKYVLKDSNGNSYPSGEFCVTTECITETTNQVNSGSFSSLGDVLPISFNFAKNAHLSREQLFLIPFIGPIIVVLLAISALLVPVCCGRSGSRCTPQWQKCPSAWTAGCIICQLPCIFLYVAVAWPMLMIAGDVCASGANIADNYVLSYGDDLCSFAGGTGGLQQCSYTESVSLLGSTLQETVNVSVLGVVRGVAGACSDPDPIASPLNDIAQQAAPFLFRLASTYVKSTSSGTSSFSFSDGVALSPTLRGLVLNATNATTAALVNFVAAETASGLSCGSVSGAVGSVKDALCCDAMPPLYWYASAWYLIAWAMCCCGLPAACLGRKRFPTSPWGKMYEAELAGATADVGAAGARYGRPPAPPPGDATGGVIAAYPGAPQPVADAVTVSPTVAAVQRRRLRPSRSNIEVVASSESTAAQYAGSGGDPKSPDIDDGVFEGRNMYAGTPGLARTTVMFPPRPANSGRQSPPSSGGAGVTAPYNSARATTMPGQWPGGLWNTQNAAVMRGDGIEMAASPAPMPSAPPLSYEVANPPTSPPGPRGMYPTFPGRRAAARDQARRASERPSAGRRTREFEQDEPVNDSASMK